MKEVGIDVGQQKPKLLTDELMEKVDKIVVMDPNFLKKIPPEYSSKIEEWRIEGLLGKSRKSYPQGTRAEHGTL